MIPRSRVSVLTPAAGDAYAQLVLATEPGSLQAYWPLSEGSGTTITDESGNGRNGTYNNGGLLGQPGIGDGRTSVWFDGSNDWGDVYSDSLRDAWSWAAWSVAFWVKMNSAALWTDGQLRRCFTMSGGSNFIWLRKSNGANRFQSWHRLNGNDYLKDVTIGEDVSDDWFHVGYSSKTAANAYIYINGEQTLCKSGCPAPSGDAISTAQISANAETHHGWLAHVALWTTELTAAQFAALAAAV
jgi:hypothetical protein